MKRVKLSFDVRALCFAESCFYLVLHLRGFILLSTYPLDLSLDAGDPVLALVGGQPYSGGQGRDIRKLDVWENQIHAGLKGRG